MHGSRANKNSLYCYAKLLHNKILSKTKPTCVERKNNPPNRINYKIIRRVRLPVIHCRELVRWLVCLVCCETICTSFNISIGMSLGGSPSNSSPSKMSVPLSRRLHFTVYVFSLAFPCANNAPLNKIEINSMLFINK